MVSNVKVVKQHDLRDCGIACLLSIIKYYGGNVPLEKLRIDTHTNKNGTTAYNLVYCAKKYGLDAAGYKMTMEQLLQKAIVPCIAHVNYNGLEHFIVIYGIFSKKLLVMDPAKGKKYMDFDKFAKIWSGYIIMFYPTGKLPFIKPSTSLIKQLYLYIKYDKRLLSWIFITNSILIILIICSSYYFKIGLEYSNDNLKVIIICFFFVTIMKCFFNYLKDNLETYLDKNLDVYLTKGFVNHLFRIPSKAIVNRTIGEIVTRMGEINNIKGLFSELFTSFFLDLLLSFVTMLILYNFNKSLFLILCVSLLFYLILGLISSHIVYERVIRNIELEDSFNTVLVENINCYQSVKNLSVTEQVLEKLETKSSEYIFHKFKFARLISKLNNGKNMIGEFSIFLVNSYGFYLMIHGKISVANLILFNSLMTFFLDPIKNLINSLPKYHFLKASFEKINEFISIEEEKANNNCILPTSFNIKLSNVDFDYNDYLPILKNVNLIIKEKEHVMLAGISGSGKSTICKIISGTEQIKSGNISLGSTNYNCLTVLEIAKVITYVSQHEHLYTDTVKNNIIFYRDVNPELYNKIIGICHINEIIENKPLKDETVVNMESDNFSGGEIQRIILARACLNSFKILIIDEALSEVDYDLESNIIKDIRNLFKDKTIIYISHKNQRQNFERIIDIGEINEIH